MGYSQITEFDIPELDMNNKEATAALDRNFFLPDLCNVQAVLFLVLVAELLSIVLELAASGLRLFSAYHFAMTSMFVQWSVLSSAACLCRLRPILAGWTLPRAAAACYLVILLVVLVFSMLGQWLLSGAFNGSGQWQLAPWSLASNVLICAVLAGIALRYFYLTTQLSLRKQTELQARIQALQSRIRPHFLFNSMNIIASLIAVDQEAAETAVEDLSSLFRASLAETDAEVSLAEELELCRRYVRIEQLRLGERLSVDWQFDGVPGGLKIPGLCLQPLVENAIYHGIQQLPEGGTVTISGEYRDGVLHLVVGNPVAARVEPNRQGNQVAQLNIHDRLQALYGPKAGLLSERDGDHHRAEIYYPVVAEGASA